MILELIIYVALFGGVGLAIYSVYKRIKNTNKSS